jgi:hypothetical protein
LAEFGVYGEFDGGWREEDEGVDFVAEFWGEVAEAEGLGGEVSIGRGSW